MKVVSQSKNQMIGIPNVIARLGGVIPDCGQNLSYDSESLYDYANRRDGGGKSG